MNGELPVAFLTGAPGPGELLLLFIVVLVLFGPRRLPEIARMIGRAVGATSPNVCTWAITSCLSFFSYPVAAS